VLADSAGLDRVDATVRLATAAMARFFAAGARGARWYPRAFALYYRMLLTEPPALEQRARIVAAGVEMAPCLAAAWRSFGEPAADLRDLASGLGCPVLVAWAKRDRILQLRRSLPAIRQIPNARLATFAGGHAPFLECPDEFAAEIEPFLAAAGRDDAAAASATCSAAAQRDDARERRRVERHDAQA
jgi:4,5:9,10-diseco-3-hydroxy-5,9,17-trioxoandrosta-1(10),2-diene-4-oate hydrolase